MKKEKIIIPVVFGLVGVLLGTWAVYLVGKEWETGISPMERRLLHLIGPVAIAPLRATEVLGLDIHRGNLAFMATVTFIWWATLGSLVMIVFGWFVRRTKQKQAEHAGGG